MDDIVKANWLKALRSGEYKKGDGILKVIDGNYSFHCAIGVLCEIENLPLLEESDDVFEMTTFVAADKGKAIENLITKEGYDMVVAVNDSDVHSREELLGKGIKEEFIDSLASRYTTFGEVANFIEEYL